MSASTSIEWCDSTVNPVMGCDGCELWTANGSARHCYAGTLHERYGKNSGYADKFLEPKLFPGRMVAAARWRDLTGTKRPDKPWLDGLPRMVFISDMGDALSASVPFDFLLREVVDIVATDWPHVGMWLTKQPRRMAEFAAWLAARGRTWPARLWAGASLTDPDQQWYRVRQLREVPATLFLSIEPLLADPGVLDLAGISLVIVGGESGSGSRPCNVAWIRSVVQQCRASGVACFVKQYGSNAFECGDDHAVWPIKLNDRKGGDPQEWLEEFRVREMPS